MAFNFYFKGILHAHEKVIPWVLDEQSILAESTNKNLSQILSGSALKGKIHLRVVVWNFIDEKPGIEQAQQKMLESKRREPNAILSNVVYLIIDAKGKQSYILFDKLLEEAIRLQETLTQINEKVIRQSLEQGQIDKAAIEGVVALTTVLQEMPAGEKSSSFPYLWVISLSLVGIFILIMGIYNYFPLKVKRLRTIL